MKYLLSLLLSLVACSLQVVAQPTQIDQDALGRVFVVAFPDTSSNVTDYRYPYRLGDTTALFIYSPTDNEVTITGRGYSVVVRPRAGRMERVYLNDPLRRAPHQFVTQANVPSNSTFRVEAREPIVLYGWMMNAFGGEGWTSIPVERWGKRYYAATLPGSVVIDMTQNQNLAFVRKRRAAPGEILIIAAYDSTVVTWYAAGPIAGSSAWNVTLDAGEAYLLQSFVDTSLAAVGTEQPDIAGTTIIASKPIGVISGATRFMGVNEQSQITNNAFKNAAFEWLAPTEQHGTEFMFLPTWDPLRLTGQQNERVGEKRQFEYVRVYATSRGRTRVRFYTDSVRYDSVMLQEGEMKEFRIDFPRPHRVTSDKPVQAMMHSSAVLKYNGRIAVTGSTYDAWGAYMCELTPRQQWVQYAPFFVPSQPNGIRAYVNIVADTFSFDKLFDDEGLPIDFNNGFIPGTDLMWASYPVSTGVEHFIRAVDTTRFFAFVYGTVQGKEELNPAGSSEEEGKGDRRLAAAIAYIERLGIGFGYPLAPRRAVLQGPDSVVIDSLPSPCSMRYTFSVVGSDALGFANVEVIEEESINARLGWVRPTSASMLAADSSVTVRLEPIDRNLPAHALIAATDRSGARTTVRYSYQPDSIAFPASRVDIGPLSASSSYDTTIILRNSLDRPICLDRVAVRRGGGAYSIVSVTPTLPATLAEGASLTIQLRASMPAGGATAVDSLIVALCCRELSLPLMVRGELPCLGVDDLSFGELGRGVRRERTLSLCNNGGGIITFCDPPLIWSDPSFSIAETDLERLRGASLAPGACVEVTVAFASEEHGVHLAEARICASDSSCDLDTRWEAVVDSSIASSPLPGDRGELSVVVRPHPVGGPGTLAIETRVAGTLVARLHAADGRLLALLADRTVAAGPIEIPFDASALPSGLHYVTIAVGEVSRTVRVLILH